MNVRVGCLADFDPQDPGAVSGMPYSMRTQLQKVAQVTDLVPERISCRLSGWRGVTKRIRSSAAQFVPPQIKEPAKRLTKSLFSSEKEGSEATTPEQEAKELLEDIVHASEDVCRQASRGEQDVVFCGVVSHLLYKLDIDTPIVYFSDTTARQIHSSYRDFTKRSEQLMALWDEIEKVALHRSAAVLMATRVAADSAINDYGVPPERVHVVPMGSNHISASNLGPRTVGPPTRDCLNLCITASNPERKRLDLVIEATNILRARGWNTRLYFVGSAPVNPVDPNVVEHVGRLSLSNPSDRKIYEDLLLKSHVMLLPSKAETFGIAPAEAAHAGIPSVVSDAGGLPEVVLDGQTGLVMPQDATGHDYALAVEEMIQTPQRYDELCQAARQRAVNTLSWDQWGRRAFEIIRGVVQRDTA